MPQWPRKKTASRPKGHFSLEGTPASHAQRLKKRIIQSLSFSEVLRWRGQNDSDEGCMASEIFRERLVFLETAVVAVIIWTKNGTLRLTY